MVINPSRFNPNEVNLKGDVDGSEACMNQATLQANFKLAPDASFAEFEIMDKTIVSVLDDVTGFVTIAQVAAVFLCLSQTQTIIPNPLPPPRQEHDRPQDWKRSSLLQRVQFSTNHCG